MQQASPAMKKSMMMLMVARPPSCPCSNAWRSQLRGNISGRVPPLVRSCRCRKVLSCHPPVQACAQASNAEHDPKAKPGVGGRLRQWRCCIEWRSDGCTWASFVFAKSWSRIRAERTPCHFLWVASRSLRCMVSLSRCSRALRRPPTAACWMPRGRSSHQSCLCLHWPMTRKMQDNGNGLLLWSTPFPLAVGRERVVTTEIVRAEALPSFASSCFF